MKKWRIWIKITFFIVSERTKKEKIIKNWLFESRIAFFFSRILRVRSGERGKRLWRRSRLRGALQMTWRPAMPCLPSLQICSIVFVVWTQHKKVEEQPGDEINLRSSQFRLKCQVIQIDSLSFFQLHLVCAQAQEMKTGALDISGRIVMRILHNDIAKKKRK